MSRHSLLCHDIDLANGIETLSQHLTILLRPKKRSHQMNFIAIENGKTMKQFVYNKVFYVATVISIKDKTKADFMSRQKKNMSRHM